MKRPRSKHYGEDDGRRGLVSRSSVVSRLQAIVPTGVTTMSVTEILEDVLPNQKSTLQAGIHMTPSNQEWRSSPPKTIHTSQCKRRRRPLSLAPLSSDSSSHTRTATMPLPHRDDYSLVVWEDKFVRHQLTIADGMYLLLNESLVSTIESAVLLRATHCTSDQLMELEMIWDQYKKKRGIKDRFRHHRHPISVYTLLVENVWTHGTAFHDTVIDQESQNKRRMMVYEQKVPSSPRRHLDQVPSPRKQPAPIVSVVISSPYSPRRHQRTKRSNSNAVTKGSRADDERRSPRKLHYLNQTAYNHLSAEYESSTIRLSTFNEIVDESSHWLRDHCVDEILRTQTTFSTAFRKRFAAEKLLRLLVRHGQTIVINHFDTWVERTRLLRCQDRVARFCRMKCAQLLLTRSRHVFRRMLLDKWQRWIHLQQEQQEMEQYAAIVVVQGWMRRILVVMHIKLYKLNCTVTKIQAVWRGFHCRKILIRRQRYVLYTHSAIIVQRVVRCYQNRCHFAICWPRHRAACRIVGALRIYIAKRKKFRLWAQRVALFHSAAIIQMWMRHTLRRIRFRIAYQRKRAHAIKILFRFFKYCLFTLSFGSRVQQVFARRQNAAIKLQNAYRAKQARARFHALKDQLEAQRRNEILRLMWDNAYATTIQRWWRRHRTCLFTY